MTNTIASADTTNVIRSRFSLRLGQILGRFLSTGSPAPRMLAAPSPSPRRQPLALVESLESRVCPSVTVSVGALAGHSGESLRIAGPDSGQHVVITEDTANQTTHVQIDGNGDGIFTGPGEYDRTFDETFSQIKIKLKRGSGNTVDYLLDSDMSEADRDFRLTMGRGSNVFNFDTQGHAIENNSLLTFTVQSNNNDASESVRLDFDAIDNSEVDFGVKLGNGTNHDVQAIFHGPIRNNSLVQSDIVLGNGIHNVAVDLLGDISASSVHVKTTGGDNAEGSDNVAYFVGGQLSNDALLDIGMALHNGADKGRILVSQSHFAALDTSRAYFTLDGGEGDDTLTYGSDTTTGTIAVEGLVDALITGANDNDTINVAFAPAAAIDLTGTFRVEAHGDSGRDVFNAVLSNTAASDGSYDVLLFGGRGDDTFFVTNNDPTDGGILYDYFGYDLVNGGSGHDVATLVGDSIIAKKIDG